MPRQTLYLWKQAPFLRLVIPLMAGIMAGWYLSLPVQAAWLCFGLSILALLLFNLRVAFRQYMLNWLNGLFINLLFVSVGILLVWQKDISHRGNWLNKYYHSNDGVIVTLQEPLTEKEHSFKTTAAVQELIQGGTARKVQGNVLLYFKKDSAARQPVYGSSIIFNKPLQPVKNSGNPGSFNYERYTAFQGVYQQVFLQKGEYLVLPGKDESRLKDLLFSIRNWVLHTIVTYIPGTKEAGLAEALLVGYKDDLDRTLVQSYSNTGVVHIIAISGIHLGLIYWLLNLVFGPLKKKKQTSWIVPIAIIAGLWLFSLLAGGGPSILRSAVMFTCIVIGDSVQRKTFIYNSLAAAAFILLCINPFWLWDAGFQLSYTAVLSIVIFMKPVYNLVYFSNKIVDNVWKLIAVTLAAQVLTTPASIYHFHQFPTYFLITNLLAVPLSSCIVLLEILLCALSLLPVLAKPTGLLLHWLIQLMNHFIERMESLPMSLWNGLQINTIQLILLYAFIAALASWLLHKNRRAFFISLVCLLVFSGIRTGSFIAAGRQQQLIVYNIPKEQALDFISGRKYVFKGDNTLPADKSVQDFSLTPSRILHRVTAADTVSSLQGSYPVLLFNGRKIVLFNEQCSTAAVTKKINADLVIITKNASVDITQLTTVVNCSQLVLDASNPPRKVNKWKAEAAKLGLHCFYTVDNGAFVMNMD